MDGLVGILLPEFVESFEGDFGGGDADDFFALFDGNGVGSWESEGGGCIGGVEGLDEEFFFDDVG